MSLTLEKGIDLANLPILESSGLALSVYISLDQTNGEVNRIRLKNSVSEVQSLLEERMEDDKVARSVIPQLSSLADHEAFSKARYPGLAVLIDLDSPDSAAVFPLSEAPENRVSLGSDPFLSPLLREQCFEPVTLLCLADNGLRIFRGRCGELNEVKPNDSFPDSLEEVMRFELRAGLDGNEKYRNRTVRSAGSYHGEGPTTQVNEEFERRYFREIGEALEDYLEQDEKLFLAGVKEKLALFREVNPELAILDHELHGNFEEQSVDDILKQANQVLNEATQGRLSQELDSALELPPEKRSADPDELLEAAKNGRVDTLFLKSGESAESQDLLSLQVLRKGGHVRIVDKPGWDKEVLGALRW